MSAADRYRIDPPEGQEPRPCKQHPDELEFYAQIPVRDLSNSERPAVVRGWTCARCFRGRSMAIRTTEAA